MEHTFACPKINIPFYKYFVNMRSPLNILGKIKSKKIRKPCVCLIYLHFDVGLFFSPTQLQLVLPFSYLPIIEHNLKNSHPPYPGSQVLLPSFDFNRQSDQPKSQVLLLVSQKQSHIQELKIFCFLLRFDHNTVFSLFNIFFQFASELEFEGYEGVVRR